MDYTYDVCAVILWVILGGTICVITSNKDLIKIKQSYKYSDRIIYVVFLIAFIVATMICSIGYDKAIAEKHSALELQDKLRKPYTCQYEFIKSEYCVDINCKIYTFNLYYTGFGSNEIKKEFVAQCDARDSCQQFPTTTSEMICYLADDINTLTWRKPTIEYDPHIILLIFLIIQSVVSIFIIVIKFNNFVKLFRCQEIFTLENDEIPLDYVEDQTVINVSDSDME